MSDSMPQRIQRKRTRGWRMPPDTVYVGRPTRWGNPFYPGSGMSMGGVTENGSLIFPCATRARCVHWYAIRLEDIRQVRPEEIDALLAPLRGKNLACWCPLIDTDGQPVPCHADVLLRLANERRECA